ENRSKFYNYIYNHLKNDGYCLILSMGDGKEESKSDVSKSFDDIKRVHQESNKEITIAATSCRIVNFDTLLKEVKNNNFEIIEYGITEIKNHFSEIMYVLLKR
ncbi:MAG: class I SAM-dependent methyltransferase, partial [Bacilli bacterium]|nr:class I SAM-dependent methyltransferase [Bacilli bacterium]